MTTIQTYFLLNRRNFLRFRPCDAGCAELFYPDKVVWRESDSSRPVIFEEAVVDCCYLPHNNYRTFLTSLAEFVEFYQANEGRRTEETENVWIQLDFSDTEYIDGGNFLCSESTRIILNPFIAPKITTLKYTPNRPLYALLDFHGGRTYDQKSQTNFTKGTLFHRKVEHHVAKTGKNNADINREFILSEPWSTLASNYEAFVDSDTLFRKFLTHPVCESYRQSYDNDRLEAEIDFLNPERGLLGKEDLILKNANGSIDQIADIKSGNAYNSDRQQIYLYLHANGEVTGNNTPNGKIFYHDKKVGIKEMTLHSLDRDSTSPWGDTIRGFCDNDFYRNNWVLQFLYAAFIPEFYIKTGDMDYVNLDPHRKEIASCEPWTQSTCKEIIPQYGILSHSPGESPCDKFCAGRASKRTYRLRTEIDTRHLYFKWMVSMVHKQAMLEYLEFQYFCNRPLNSLKESCRVVVNAAFVEAKNNIVVFRVPKADDHSDFCDGTSIIIVPYEVRASELSPDNRREDIGEPIRETSGKIRFLRGMVTKIDTLDGDFKLFRVSIINPFPERFLAQYQTFSFHESSFDASSTESQALFQAVMSENNNKLQNLLLSEVVSNEVREERINKAQERVDSIKLLIELQDAAFDRSNPNRDSDHTAYLLEMSNLDIHGNVKTALSRAQSDLEAIRLGSFAEKPKKKRSQKKKVERIVDPNSFSIPLDEEKIAEMEDKYFDGDFNYDQKENKKEYLSNLIAEYGTSIVKDENVLTFIPDAEKIFEILNLSGRYRKMQRGGKIPGFGGGDTELTFLEPGETEYGEDDFGNLNESRRITKTQSQLPENRNNDGTIQEWFDAIDALLQQGTLGGRSIDENKKKIVTEAISADTLYLIQGPPGTGKTFSIVLIALYYLIFTHKKVKIATFTNNAAKRIIEEIAKNEFLCECVIQNGYGVHGKDYMPFHEGAVKWAGRYDASIDRNYQIDTSSLSSAVDNGEEAYDETRKEMKEGIRVLIGTTHSLFSNSLAMNDWRAEETITIIDEASQLTEPKTLLGLVNSEKYILVGDEKQLSPIVPNREEIPLFPNHDNDGPEDVRLKNCTSLDTRLPDDALWEPLRKIGLKNFNESLFERFLRLYANVSGHHGQLEVIYRGPIELYEFSNQEYYDGTLKAIKTAKKLMSQVGDPIVTDGEGVIFCDVPLDSSKPRSSRRHAEFIRDNILAKVNQDDWGKISIVTLFNAQVHELRQMMPGIDIRTVDRMQGHENDIVIFDIACSTKLLQNAKGLSLVDGKLVAKKLNVALTRAKKKLIIIGDGKSLAADTDEFEGVVDEHGTFKKMAYFLQSHAHIYGA